VIKHSLLTYLTSPEIMTSHSDKSKQNMATENDSGKEPDCSMKYKSITGF